MAAPQGAPKTTADQGSPTTDHVDAANITNKASFTKSSIRLSPMIETIAITAIVSPIPPARYPQPTSGWDRSPKDQEIAR